jgi:hypothetical protein
MKTTKIGRALALFLAAMLLIAALSACATTPDTASESTPESTSASTPETTPEAPTELTTPSEETRTPSLYERGVTPSQGDYYDINGETWNFFPRGDTPEELAKLFDGDIQTKLVLTPQTFYSCSFEFETTELISLIGFSILTGNDGASYPGRDCEYFTFEAFVNGEWTKLKGADGSDKFTQRNFNVNFEETYFAFSADSVFESAKFRLTLNDFHDSYICQYAELYLWTAGV